MSPSVRTSVSPSVSLNGRPLASDSLLHLLLPADAFIGQIKRKFRERETSGASLMIQIPGPGPARRRHRMDQGVLGDPVNKLEEILPFLSGAAGGFHSADFHIKAEMAHPVPGNGEAPLKTLVSNHKTFPLFEVLLVPKEAGKSCETQRTDGFCWGGGQLWVGPASGCITYFNFLLACHLVTSPLPK